MTTLGTHPFVPSAFKLGSAPACQRCPNDASHPVHDWLRSYVPFSEHDACWCQPFDGPKHPHCPMHGTDVLSAITPEEMVQLENLPNGEPFEDVGGYCQRAGR